MSGLGETDGCLVGDEAAELYAGDSCTCRTDVPHGIENPDPSAEALIYLVLERS